jgi:hypothetical protein
MTLHIVMAGHSASKPRVNALMFPAINVLAKQEDVDARQKAGHDEGKSVRLA